jgi:hypothetical protein
VSDVAGAPGGVQSLSATQFGGVNMPTMPTAHGAGASQDLEPHYQQPGSGPLSAMSSTYTTAQRASVWRKPAGVLPLSKATLGSTFNPFG